VCGVPFEPRGIFAPNATPFSSQSVDEPALRRLLDYLVEQGASGVVPCGTTGESATLSHEEHRSVIETTVEHLAGRVPVIAGAGSNSTAESLELVKHAEGVGADAALVICPYYNRPTQQGLIAHFGSLAESTPLPLIVYNIPKRTGVNLDAATTAELSRIPNIVGVKEASGDLGQVMDVISLSEPGFAVLSGDGYLTFAICCLGGAGGILAEAHVLPGEWKRMVELIAAGQVEEAREIHYRLLPLAQALFLETNPSPVKAVLEIMGICSGDVRLPLLAATDGCRAALREELEELGLV
jgi:4-hydroxy-tetrahydrodipicolinate synthase